jgi:hypothetical protein
MSSSDNYEVLQGETRSRWERKVAVWVVSSLVELLEPVYSTYIVSGDGVDLPPFLIYMRYRDG